MSKPYRTYVSLYEQPAKKHGVLPTSSSGQQAAALKPTNCSISTPASDFDFQTCQSDNPSSVSHGYSKDRHDLATSATPVSPRNKCRTDLQQGSTVPSFSAFSRQLSYVGVPEGEVGIACMLLFIPENLKMIVEMSPFSPERCKNL